LPFEREEVRAACPAIKLLDAAEYLEIASRPDCQAVITDESRRRRLLYRDQEQRDCAQKQYGGDYLSFLRLCRLKMLIRKMTPENIDRVYELAQRTNQMNFSGNRYSRDELRDIVGRADRHTYVVDCEDRFGNYGTVGFCIVNSTEHRMLDLMFSCRIQGKRVEHAFLSHIVKQYRHLASTTFSVDYRRTGKNAASGAVFTDLGFQVTGEHAGITRLELSPESAIREDAIIEVEDHTLYLSRNPR
jgi:FkbH-like protein